jgi:aminoglycoside 6-adenylyltransferase
MIEKLIAWGEGQELVRAMVLTSSRAVPGYPYTDQFSDYDLILALRDVRPYHDSRDWLAAFGTVLAMYRDPMYVEDGLNWSGNVVQFEEGLKIDFTLWPVEMMQKVTRQETLPAEFDAGYRVLLDKDGLTEGIKPPSFRGYIPQPPTEAEYLERIELCFHNATYVAKYLWRDDLVAARHVWESVMLQEDLLPMLTWYIEIGHNWSLKPGPYGRGLKKHLRPDLYADLESTIVGPRLEDNWDALFKTLDLMRKAALEVGERLGFTYPWDLDRKATAYLTMVRDLPRDAKSFPKVDQQP